jgi:integrase
MSSVQPLVDAAGRRRSPATMPAFHAGKAPRNKGQRYPADPPTVDEIVAVMRVAGQARYGARLNGLIVVLWRAGLRIHEALSLLESDLDPRRGSILVRHGKNDRRREVGMDAWGWSALQPWLDERGTLPSAPYSASSSARLVAIAGQNPLLGSSCIGQRSRPESAGASRLIS